MSMPDDSNARMEELLKAYAQKREADSVVVDQLHPATRRLLHGEIQRTFRAPSPQPKTHAWIPLWPRLAFGAVLLAILSFVIVVAERTTSRGKFSLAQRAPIQESSMDPVRSTAETENRQLRKVVAADALKEALSKTETTLPVTQREIVTRDSYAVGVKPSSPVPAEKLPLPDLRKRYGVTTEEKEKKAVAFDTGNVGPLNSESSERQAPRSDSKAETPVATRAPQPSGSSAGSAGRSNDIRKKDAARDPGSFDEFAKTTPKNLAKQEKPATLVRKEIADPLGTKEATMANERSSRALGITAKLNKPEEVALQSEHRRAGQVLHFVQSNDRAFYRRNFQSPATPDVLSAFQWERTEDKVRIIDADGSFYEGTITNPLTPKVPALSAQTAIPASRPPSSSVSEDAPTSLLAPNNTAAFPLFFSVAGTNLTLNQQVVFQGSFFATNVLTPLREVAAKAKSGVLRAGENSTVESVSSSAGATNRARQQTVPSLRGRAIVGGSNEFQINARLR